MKPFQITTKHGAIFYDASPEGVDDGLNNENNNDNDQNS
jgi:hypothetical protein